MLHYYLVNVDQLRKFDGIQLVFSNVFKEYSMKESRYVNDDRNVSNRENLNIEFGVFQWVLL